MKVSDTDTRNYLQQIIQLLEDPINLKSLEDCKAAVCNIHKIENDSVDVFLNVDQEMLALKTAINEVRQEFGMQEKRTLDTVESLKEEYSQLREQLTKKLADVEARVDSIERDVQLVKEQTDTSLQKQEKKHQEMLTTVTSQLTKRYDDAEAKVDSIKQDVQSVKEQTDTVLQKQETSLENMSASVATCQIRIGTVEENVQTFSTKLQEFETGKEEANSALQEQKKFSESMSTSVATHEVRLVAVEENLIKLNEMGQRTEQNNSCAKGTSRKRRPESGGLRQLKNQTEDKLDSLRKLGFISTKQMEEANKMLQDKKSVVIKGNPGEGKTTTALHLIDNEKYIDRRVVFSDPEDWKTVDTDWVDIVVLDDIFGQSDFDQSRLKKWQDYLPTIQEHVDAGKLQVIITTRVDILAKAYTHLGSINLFYDEFSFTLSSDKLQESEKMNILNKELNRYKKLMHDGDKKECIANFKGLIGFPQCCSYFAGDNGLFAQGLDFFKQPEKLFTANISRLEDHQFLSLAFLFCTGDIDEKYLSPEAMTEWGNSVLKELSSHLGIKKKKASVTLLSESYGNFSGLYVKKYQSSIKFSHNTVYEAVGLILGQRSPEMVVKYCDSLYLNQRTYAAESKDETSRNVFIPASAYGHLAERIILEVLQRNITFTHSALKEHQFVIELKNHLSKCYRINDFLFSEKSCMLLQNVSDGNCQTFLQNLLQGDENTVNLVYDQFLEFLICRHDIDIFDTECRKCNEKKCLLELALYYNQLDIADKLIDMNACISPISLCNAVRHGNLNRVKIILDNLKKKGSLDTTNKYVKKSLCRAFISGNPSLVELLLKEGIDLDSRHLICVVKQGDMDSVVKFVEYLKHGNDWEPLQEKGNQKDLLRNRIIDVCPSLQNELQFSRALYLAYREGKLDLAEFLLNEEVKVTMNLFLAVLGNWSFVLAAKVVQDLKDTDQWDPDSDCVSEAAKIAYKNHNCDLFQLLIQKEVAFSIKNLPVVASWGTIESLTKVIEHLKERNKWDPKSEIASETLQISYITGKNDMSEKRLQERVTLTMSNLRGILHVASRDSIIKAIHHLKDTGNWDTKSICLSEILFRKQKYDDFDILIKEGVIEMDDLQYIIHYGSHEFLPRAIQLLKNTGNWDPESLCASDILSEAYLTQKYDVCDLLVNAGVSLSMEDLSHLMWGSRKSFESVRRAIEHLKISDCWDPNCEHLSTELVKAFKCKENSLCDLLIMEGVSLSMNNLPGVTLETDESIVTKAIQHLKATNNWDSNSCHAVMALQTACEKHKFDVSNLLLQEGVSLTMKNILDVVLGTSASDSPEHYLKETEFIKQIIKHLKDAESWDPSSEFVRQALEKAFTLHKNAIFDLLLQEKISPTMKTLCDSVDRESVEFVKKLVQQIKSDNTWDPSSHLASNALELAFMKQNRDVYNLLIQEKISPTMKILCDSVGRESVEFVTKLVQQMKSDNTWDPSSHLASNALELAFWKQNHDICNLLIHEKDLLRMKNLPAVVCYGSIEDIAIVIQLLKEANIWDPSSNFASKALVTAYQQIYTNGKQSCDVSALLIQEGVSLEMKDFGPYLGSCNLFTKVIHHLKDNGNWNPHCDSASDALKQAYVEGKYDVCDLLIQEGILPTMENLFPLLNNFWQPVECVSKLVQHLKDKGNWNPHCGSASVALQQAYVIGKYDVCDLLIQEGISLTMENLLPVVNISRPSLQSVSNVVQHLKDKGNWNPHCESASVALQEACRKEDYAVCDLLIEEGILPKMENLPYIINLSQLSRNSVKYVSKIVQHLKDKGNWNPLCESASDALQKAYVHAMCDICDLLIQEGISPVMKNLSFVVHFSQKSLKAVLKIVQHLKDKGNWNPHCESATYALVLAYVKRKDAVCNLLIQEGISLMMENLPRVIHLSWHTPKAVSKVEQHLKDRGNWNPHCKNASDALEWAYVEKKYDICDLLIQEGILLTMGNLLSILNSFFPSLESVSKVVQHLKDNGNWNSNCESASIALQHAFRKRIYDVCDFLIQEGILPLMENLPIVINLSFQSQKSLSKIVQHLKDKGNWNPHCATASDILKEAYLNEEYDVGDLLIEEGILPTMENLSMVINLSRKSVKYVSKIVQHLKDRGYPHWNPHCESASVALQQAYMMEKYDVCDLLIKEGILPMMESLLFLINQSWPSLKSVSKVVQHLKDSNNWFAQSEYAVDALVLAFYGHTFGICDLLIRNGVLLTMKNLFDLVCKSNVTFSSVKRVIQHLKDTRNWNPTYNIASETLQMAYKDRKSHIFALLIQQGVSLTIMNLLDLYMDFVHQ